MVLIWINHKRFYLFERMLIVRSFTAGRSLTEIAGLHGRPFSSATSQTTRNRSRNSLGSSSPKTQGLLTVPTRVSLVEPTQRNGSVQKLLTLPQIGKCTSATPQALSK